MYGSIEGQRFLSNYMILARNNGLIAKDNLANLDERIFEFTESHGFVVSFGEEWFVLAEGVSYNRGKPLEEEKKRLKG